LRVEKEMARWQFGRMFHDAGYAYQEFLTLSSVVPPEELIEVLFNFRDYHHVRERIPTLYLTCGCFIRKFKITMFQNSLNYLCGF